MSQSTPTTAELLKSLVAAFGDPAAICELLAPDAEWWITPTVGVLGSPTRGRDAIRGAMDVIFNDMYGDVTTEVHHLVESDGVAACRLTMRATALFAGSRPYENEYSVWAKASDGAITHVWEYLDVAHAMGQFDLQQS